MSQVRKIRSIPVLAWPAVMAMAVAVLGLAIAHGVGIVHLDVVANRTVHSHAAEPFTSWVFIVTTLGATPVLIAVTLAAFIGLAARGRWRAGLAIVLGYAVTDATVALVKLIVSRPRPEENLTEASGFSFPSGHSAMSVAVYGCLAVALARGCRARGARAAFVLAGIGLVVLIGLSRIYLGVHYPSDVLAGWITGAAILIPAWIVAGRVRPAPARA
jgi:undecaprenyl-diphosphatase